MILVILTIIMIVACVIFCILENNTNCDFEIATIVTTTTSILMVFVISLVFFITHIGTNQQIIKNEIEYKALIKQVEIIDSDYEDVSKTRVIQNVAEWNKKVASAKYWVKNPWTRWLCNKKVADNLKFIDM